MAKWYFTVQLKRFTGEIWFIDQADDLEIEDEKGPKTQLYIYPLSLQKSQDTDFILAQRIIVVVARVPIVVCFCKIPKNQSQWMPCIECICTFYEFIHTSDGILIIQ